ncbi:ATP-binding protein [Sedimentibacter sp. zth1]|uniref:ATP-binding protein n=1 Tax=Sedimentibacter sp. zth1 TaxID=2816908 RepID=UPI001A9242AE|nr:ATP-binding protein [Sedimentibacter sp. zth1]QSX06363.1 ATP-binding protein [Sedimentibacter sp. zth1]
MKRKTLLFSILIIIAAQININLNNSDFKIAVAIILFPLFSILFGKFPVLPITLIVAPGVFFSRALYLLVETGSFMDAFTSYGPEISFYFVYGLLTYFYYNLIDYKINKPIYILPLALIDYIANSSEMLFRISNDTFTIEMQLILVSIALVRTLMILIFWIGLEYQNFYLLKNEHAQRYKNLLLMISNLKSEIIWMNKNAANIESTMSISYKLYENLINSDIDSTLSGSALEVAKDIHEIKKEYNLIIRGITDALDNSFEDKSMKFSELLQMLKDKIDLDGKNEGKTILWDINCKCDFITNKHYLLLSILRNLLNNAVEAYKNEDNYIKISFALYKTQLWYVFYISNYANKISEEHLDQLFEPGFSTKINYSTGIVNRGLGLCLVKDLVENKLQGKINVKSTELKTTFYIEIPVNTMEN